jgi:hypothetical protein
MNLRYTFLVCCLFFTLFGCSKKQAETPQSDRQYLPIFQTQLNELGYSIVAKKCLKPIGIKSEHIKNRHDSAIIDEIRQISCKGYEIKIYLANVTKPPRELPLTLDVTQMLKDIEVSQYIGRNSALVIKAYGQPSEIDGESMVYPLNESGNIIKFKVKKGLVKGITWYWDVD